MITTIDTIEESYLVCHRVARRSRSSFYRCFSLLGKPKCRAMEALYAFMRHTDDLADSPATVAERRDSLSGWRRSLEAALDGGPKSTVDDENERILPALVDVVRKFGVPAEHLTAVIDGVEMDLGRSSFETFDELAEYCHRVSTAVGMACIHIWGFDGDRAFESARSCGLSFQMTNILRDLAEDAGNGRVYLPQEELRRFDYAAADLTAGVTDERFERLMDFQLDRVDRFYREGVALFDHLEPDGRPIFGMMTSVYHRLFARIRSDPAAVLRRRVRLSRFDKLSIAARWMMMRPRRPELD